MQLRTTCNRDCPDACGIVATVEGGRVVKIQGDPDHPVTRGSLCYRTSRFLERQYSPERLRTPLVRRGGRLVETSWDEALDLVAEKMLRIHSESGPAAILHYRSGGTLGMVKFTTDLFFESFGPVTVKKGDICSGAGDAAQMEDFGEEDSHDLFDLMRSRTIVLWGKNPHVSSPHLLPVLLDARRAGARIVLVDPVRHRGADLAGLYLQPRPGGDIALALGVARRLFETGRTDPGAASYCDHLDAFRAQAFARDLSGWAELAGVSAEELVSLADAYANGPSAILVGWGMQRKGSGCATVRALDALGAISGNLGVEGGGVSFYFKRRGAFDTSFATGESPRKLWEPLLGREILEAADPAVRMVWVTAGNPVAMLPESETVRRALETRELTVVVDSFLTDTAEAAHVVLPTTTMLEDDDLVGAYGHHWIGEVRPVATRLDGVRTDHEIVQALAPRVGLGGRFAEDAETWKRRIAARAAERGAGIDAMREGPVRSPFAPKVLFADRKFPTASGKVNLVRELDPAPTPTTAERPLLLMALSTERAQSSQWAGSREDARVATVHPDAAPGLADGAEAIVESELGSMRVVLRLDARQRRDVLLLPKGGWRRDGAASNALVPARLTDAGGGAVLYDTPVRLLPVNGASSAR